MRNHVTKWLCALLFVLVMTGSFCMKMTVYAQEEELQSDSGKFKGNQKLNWELNYDDRSLLINGAGMIPSNEAPWKNAAVWQQIGDGELKLYIEEGVTGIGDNVFADCAKLYSVCIEGKISIGNAAFRGCSSINNVKIEGSVEKIGNTAFTGCNALWNVTAGDIGSIGNSAFAECQKLWTFTAGNIESIGNNAFQKCPLSQLSYRRVEKIGDNAFQGCNKLTDIKLNGLLSLGKGAFQSCTSLKEIRIDGLTKLSSSVFEGCKGLQSVNVSGSVASIGNRAFYGCSSLKNIVLSEGLKTIGADAFYSCKGLRSIKFPESLTDIYDCAFRACSGLGSITLPAKVKYIGKAAFDGCSNVVKVIVYNKSCQFGDAKSLPRYAVISGYPDSTAEQYAKKNKRYTEPISKSPAGGKSSQSAASKGAKLTDSKTKAKYMVTKKGSTVEYVGTTNKKAVSVTIPATVKIKGVTYKVTSIAKNAFKNNRRLKKLTISGNVTKIGSRAFYNCKNLNTITIKSKKLTAKTVGSKAFSKAGNSNYKKLKVKVPSGKYKTYQKLLKSKGLSSKAKVRK